MRCSGLYSILIILMVLSFPLVYIPLMLPEYLEYMIGLSYNNKLTSKNQHLSVKHNRTSTELENMAVMQSDLNYRSTKGEHSEIIKKTTTINIKEKIKEGQIVKNKFNVEELESNYDSEYFDTYEDDIGQEQNLIEENSQNSIILDALLKGIGHHDASKLNESFNGLNVGGNIQIPTQQTPVTYVKNTNKNNDIKEQILNVNDNKEFNVNIKQNLVLTTQKTNSNLDFPEEDQKNKMDSFNKKIDLEKLNRALTSKESKSSKDDMQPGFFVASEDKNSFMNVEDQRSDTRYNDHDLNSDIETSEETEYEDSIEDDYAEKHEPLIKNNEHIYFGDDKILNLGKVDKSNKESASMDQYVSENEASSYEYEELPHLEILPDLYSDEEAHAIIPIKD